MDKSYSQLLYNYISEWETHHDMYYAANRDKSTISVVSDVYHVGKRWNPPQANICA